MTISPTFFLRGYHIANEGATLLAGLGPGCNPDEVVVAFSMIGMGDEARLWRQYARRAEIASDALAAKAAEIVPDGSSMLDVLLGSDTPEMRTLIDDAALQRGLSADAWKVLGKVIDNVRARLPSFDH